MTNSELWRAGQAGQARRVVTGHDSEGRSVIISDASSPFWLGGMTGGPVITDLWRIGDFPVPLDSGPEGCAMPIELAPPAGGNVLRLLLLPPDRDYLPALGDGAAAFSALGKSGEASASHMADAPHPLMHRTDTIDYIIILAGEVHVVLDRAETLLSAGDILVQRGTNHAWSNRSDQPCLLAAVLNGAECGRPQP